MATGVSYRSALIPCLALFFFALGASNAHAQSSATPGALRAYSTIYSIGVEWDIEGDWDYDAAASLEYRLQGGGWTPAMPLVRVDLNGLNMLAGSVMFLTPGTTYEVRVTLSDPDGGGGTRTATVSTRKLPMLPVGGRVFHVVPGDGGGDGSSGNPFRGVPAAHAVARAGDTFLLHAGYYGGRVWFDKPGTANDYLVWKSAGDGEVLMDGFFIAANHIWLEGLTVRNLAFATFSVQAPTNVVLRRNSFYNNHYSIYLQGGGSNWYIADNTIVGDMPYWTESFAGEGIELNNTSGHTVAHNSITNTADGISYPIANVDVFGNDIFDTSDDGIEIDGGGTNVRIWGNRIHNAAHNGISFQPQTGAPSYIVRNQIAGNMEAPFKFRTTDRFLLLHNTIVSWGNAWWGDGMFCCNEFHLFRAISRNNLWINVNPARIWNLGWEAPDWRTDLDYDGFDSGGAPVAFTYGGAAHRTVAQFAAASGLQTHGRDISRHGCFETFDFPTAPPSPVPPQLMTLQPSCGAVDAGVILPNINAGAFAGGAPDMGAHEHAGERLTYGPRASDDVGGGGSGGSGGSTPPTARAVPGSIEAEDFDDNGFWDATPENYGGQYRSTAVDIELTTDAGGGYSVGWIDPGEWLQYTIDVQTAGAYQISARVASPYDGSAMTISVDGSQVGGPLIIPNTGWWQNWQTVTTSSVNLTAGIHHLRLTSITGAFNVNRMTIGAASASAGSGHAVPGLIEAEDFDEGGFWDATAANYGGQYRSTAVDIEATTDSGGGYNVGWMDPGEWLDYTISVGTSGAYQILLRVASPMDWATVAAFVDGAPAGGTLSVPNTGWWQNWQTIASPAINLAAGTHTLRIATDTGGLNLNHIAMQAAGEATGHRVPGVIQAEDFDEGGYWDSTAANRGGQYRPTAVDIEATADAGGGYNIGWMDPGEWLEYTIQVDAAGVYAMSARVASLMSGSTMRLFVDGLQVGGAMHVPNTGWWQTWQTMHLEGVYLTAGTHRVRLLTDTGAMNVNWISF